MKNLYIILFVLPLIGFGQGWEQNYEGGFSPSYGVYLQSVIEIDDGGYIITGSEEKNLLILRTNENGDSIWTKNYLENDIFQGGGIIGRSIQKTSDGGYIICGNTNQWVYPPNVENILGDNRVYLMKTDENGDSLWTKRFGGMTFNDFGWSVKQTTDGGYIICGSIGLEDENNNLYIIKTDENGDEDWSQIFGGQDYHSGYSVQQTNDGGYIITGSINDGGYLLKLDESGDELWYQTYWCNGFSVQQTNDGGYILIGGCLIKTDENGDIVWMVGQEGVDGQQTLDGGYIIINDINSTYKHLIKIDQNGEEEWFQDFDQNNVDPWWGSWMGHSIQQTSDGGYIITGRRYLQNSDNFQYSVLIKTDSQGNVTSTIELPTPTSKRELLKTTNILGQENITIKNQPLIEIYDDGSVEKKYIIE